MALFSSQHIKISGISVTVPSKIVSNFDLNYLTDQQKKTLVNTTGIENRRIAGEQETASDLCIRSANKAIGSLGWDPKEIEILVFVTQTPDYSIPGSSMFIQHELGLSKNCIAIDINQGCSGYVYGLSIISAMMSSGKIKKGLLLVGDTLTKTIAKDDQSLIPVFSDAGSCTALEWNPAAKPMHFNLQSDGSGYDKIIIRKGGARSSNQADSPFLFMNGQDIFNFGLKEVASNISTLLETQNCDISNIDYFVMHQANLLLNETIRKKIGVDINKTFYSLKEYGNTSCASIPVSIAANAQNLQNVNAEFLLAGFGVGLSWGSALINFDHVKCLELNEL
jgi:3-oxoacyl-[acyl-carrier-protein] synthase III